jgi:hypothetical protein
MTSPPTPPVSSQPLRSRTPSDLSVRSPQLLHRPHTGRIERTRSTSSRLLSIRNQEAIWEAATGRNWAPVDEHSSPEQSLPEYITPLSLSVTENRGATSSPSIISAPEALRPIEEDTTFGPPASTSPDPEVTVPSLRCVSAVLYKLGSTDGISSSMEFMMPPQYSHFGSHSSSYQSSELCIRAMKIEQSTDLHCYRLRPDVFWRRATPHLCAHFSAAIYLCDHLCCNLSNGEP